MRGLERGLGIEIGCLGWGRLEVCGSRVFWLGINRVV